jgi:TolB protein
MAPRFHICTGVLLTTLASVATLTAIGETPPDAGAPPIEWISPTADGGSPDAACDSPSISRDGTKIAFVSRARNLVSPSTNGCRQIFLRDRVEKKTVLVSCSSQGEQGDLDSEQPVISPNGQYVAFTSRATKLVPGGTTGSQIFVRDPFKRRTILISQYPQGQPGNHDSCRPAISFPDGSGRCWVAFESKATNLTGDAADSGRMTTEVFVRLMDLNVSDPNAAANNVVQMVSLPWDSGDQTLNGGSSYPGISDDGRFVKFETTINPDTGSGSARQEIRVRDRCRLVVGQCLPETTVRNCQGCGGPVRFDAGTSTLSGDGYHVFFSSDATELNPLPGDTVRPPGIFVSSLDLDKKPLDKNRLLTQFVSQDDSRTHAISARGPSATSGDGRFAIFISDTADPPDGMDRYDRFPIFLRDRSTGHTQPLALRALKDRCTGAMDRPVMSEDGRCIAFQSIVQKDTGSFAGIYAAPLPLATTPVITDVQPAFGSPGGEPFTVTVTESNLSPVEAADLGPGITVTPDPATPVEDKASQFNLKVRILNDLTPGPRDLIVQHANGQVAIRHGGFVISWVPPHGIIDALAPHFSVVSREHESRANLLVINRGSSPLVFSVSDITGPFQVLGSRGPYILMAKTSTPVLMVFRPPGPGRYLGKVTLSSDDESPSRRPFPVDVTGISR